MADKKKIEKVFSGSATLRSSNGDLQGELSIDISPWEFNDRSGFTSQMHLVRVPSEFNGIKKEGVNLKGNFDPMDDGVFDLLRNFVNKVIELKKSQQPVKKEQK